MANKKETAKSQEQKVQQQAKQSSVPENVELPKEEKAAIQIVDNGPTGKKYRLKNPYRQYTDSESGTTWVGDQSKPLPENYSNETLERIKHGFLVEDTGETGEE